MALRRLIIGRGAPTYVDMTPKEEADFEQSRIRRVKPLAVKAEARRRILERYPDWKQANMTARGVELQDIWRRNGQWTAREQTEADALQAAWNWIKAVRAVSDVIEAMNPIPPDFDDSARWPQ